ncbi:unnamed protein product [Ectocarpus sp. 12 AP-2014]
MSMDSSEITCGGSDDGHEMNPFASFAFGGGASEPPTLAARPHGAKRKKINDCLATSTTVARTGEKPEKKKGCKGEAVCELSPEELRVFRKRWRGMADRGACVEDQRFQVLVGAVLSSRAQASVVDEGLSRLRARSGGLTAAEMAEVAQDDLADILRHVHWNKAKAKHIRESAGIIVRRHRGVVPRRRAELLALPGVGPALVEILLNVFDSWDKDDKALVAAAAAAAASSPEARAVVGGGNRDGDVDGVEGDGGGGCGGDGVGDGSSGGGGGGSVGGDGGVSGGDGSRLGVGGEGADDDDETGGERRRLPRSGGMQTESGRQLVDLTGGVDGDSTDGDGGDDNGPSHGERIKDEEPTTQRKRIEDQDGEDGKRGADQSVTGPELVKNDLALLDEDASHGTEKKGGSRE